MKRIWNFLAGLGYPASLIAFGAITVLIFAAGFFVYLLGGKQLFDSITIGVVSVVGFAMLIGAIKVLRLLNQVYREIKN